jgi:hypothetical protein
MVTPSVEQCGLCTHVLLFKKHIVDGPQSSYCIDDINNGAGRSFVT